MKKNLASRTGTAIRLTLSDKVFVITNYIVCSVILLIVIYPLYLIVISSVSEPYAVLQGKVVIWPVDFSLTGYESLLNYAQLWRSYLNSTVYTTLGTLISVAITLMAAYATSRSFLGKGFVSFFILFTMFFSGGLIPTFLLMRDIGLYNNPLILILYGSVQVWNLMVARTFIKTTIPNELYEAAILDGASHFRYFARVVLPLSGTIIAVLCVYYGVYRWNDYFIGMIYIRDPQWLPLQTVMRSILASLTVTNKDLINSMIDNYADLVAAMRKAEVAKYCIIVVSTIPAVLLYTTMQKYFVKGVMIGSIKG